MTKEEMAQKILDKWDDLEMSGDSYRYTSDDYLRDAVLVLGKSDDDAAEFVASYGEEYYEYGCEGSDLDQLAAFIIERVAQ